VDRGRTPHGPRRPARGSRASRRTDGRADRPERSQGRPPSRPAAAEPGSLPRWILEEIKATAARGRADQAIDLFREAVGHLQEGDPARAAAAAARAKAIASRSGAIRELLGIALYRTERYREALRELQAYRRVTGRADQNHLIADSYRALGEAEKAVEPAMEALRAEISEDARAEATIVGGAALADLGRFTEALGVLRSFPPEAGRARAFDLRLWYVTGDVLERAGRPAEAAEEFRRVLRHDPDAFDAADRLARLA
jgi:tetratricopeptide (TPR) repeat protein